MFALYRILTDAGAPLIRLYLGRRRRRGKEDAARIAERLGRPGLARPAGPLVWVHAASVGEAQSILPLLQRLSEDRPDLGLLVTTGTVTSARLLARRLPPRALHQYVPVDRSAYARRFLDHWRPDLALWVESEFWPNLIGEARRKGVPLVLINGRISDRSYARWRRLPGLIRPLLESFASVIGQTERDAERLRLLGARRVACIGNLKSAAPPLPADADTLARLRAVAGRRPLWLAASTHAGEEEIAAEVHDRLAAGHPGVLTVIAPRHPERGATLAATLRARGRKVAQRSRHEAIHAETEIYLADTLGELGLFFRLAPVVFVGGSLVRHGGQNPLEPARLGCAVLFGPHMHNFQEMATEMAAASAARRIGDSEELGQAVGHLLADERLRGELGTAARIFANAEAGVLDRAIEVLAPFLPAIPAARKAAGHAGS